MNKQPSRAAMETAKASSGSESPSSKCPICLSEIVNPAYTDQCFHQFCFICLLEWSKVKAVCPLCKQDFKTIAYDVQSYSSFKELQVVKPKPTPTLSSFHQEFIPGFSISGVIRHRDYERTRRGTPVTLEMQYLSRRHHQFRTIQLLKFPSHRISSHGEQFAFLPDHRMAVYQSGLKVQYLRDFSRQFVGVSPRHFEQFPMRKLRLYPWLKREVEVLIDVPSDHRVSQAVELVIRLLFTYSMCDQQFQTRLIPFLGARTIPFLQELYCFARSDPYTMYDYDKHVVYGRGMLTDIWSGWDQNWPANEESSHRHASTGAFFSRLSWNHAPPQSRQAQASVNNQHSCPSTSTAPQPDAHSSASFSKTTWNFNGLPSEQPQASVDTHHDLPTMSTIPQSDSPLPGTSGTRTSSAWTRRFRLTNSHRSARYSTVVVDVSDDNDDESVQSVAVPNDSDEDIEVVGEDKPWVSRSPILISSDSEGEVLDDQSNFSEKAEHDIASTMSQASVEEVSEDEVIDKKDDNSSVSCDFPDDYHDRHRQGSHKTKKNQESERMEVSVIDEVKGASCPLKSSHYERHRTSTERKSQHSRSSQNHSHSRHRRHRSRSKTRSRSRSRSYDNRSSDRERRSYYKERNRKYTVDPRVYARSSDDQDARRRRRHDSSESSDRGITVVHKHRIEHSYTDGSAGQQITHRSWQSFNEDDLASVKEWNFDTHSGSWKRSDDASYKSDQEGSEDEDEYNYSRSGKLKSQIAFCSFAGASSSRDKKSSDQDGTVTSDDQSLTHSSRHSTLVQHSQEHDVSRSDSCEQTKYNESRRKHKKLKKSHKKHKKHKKEKKRRETESDDDNCSRNRDDDTSSKSHHNDDVLSVSQREISPEKSDNPQAVLESGVTFKKHCTGHKNSHKVKSSVE